MRGLANIDMNVLLLIAAFFLALSVIFVLYAIVMYKDTKNQSGKDLQLSTKNILEQVKVLFDKGEYSLVQLLATKYLDRVPGHQEVRMYLAKAYYMDKKYNNAVKQCLEILKKDSNNIDTRKLLGDCFIKKQMPGKALKEYEEIFDYRSNDKEVVRTLAELYRDTEQLFSAISVYNILVDLLEVESDIAEVYLILAELNEEARDYPAAFEAYKSRLKIYPTNIPTNQKLVDLYIKIKNQTMAIETLIYMLSFVTEPKTLIWVYDRLIAMYVETEEYEKAIEYSNKLLDVQGSDKFKIRNNIAKYYLKLNNTSTGLAILEDLVMMSQNGYDVTTQLASAYIECKEYQKALDKYLALLDKSTQSEAKNVRLLLCKLYIDWAADMLSQNDINSAIKHLEEAAGYNPTNPEIYYYRALIRLEQKDYAAAIELLHRAMEYDKQKVNHVKYLLKLSESHHNLNHFFEERKALADLLKIDGNNPMGLYLLGLMYATQHDTKEAEECFKKALQYDPELLPAKYNLGLLYEINNLEKAKQLYLEVLEIDPNYVEVKNALANIETSEF